MQLEQPHELALFRTADAALAFAFNFKHGQTKRSGLAVMMGGGGGNGRGLGGLDGAGQAGMIEGEVERLDPSIRSRILIARFAPRVLPCACKAACCSGWRSNRDWLLAVSDIVALVREAALAGCTVNFTLRYAIVQRYFGVRRSLVDAATAADVDRHTASAHAGKVIGYLREEERQARYAIEARLKVAGIVE